VAHLFPTQGHWTEGEFLALPAPHRFELSQGRLEALAMPTWVHALVGLYLVRLLDDFAKERKLGRAVPAPLYVRLWEGEIRQPDIVFCFSQNIHDRSKVQNGADLAVEIVSDGKENRDRDLVEKRKLYAQAGIREYWIVDPQERVISVLSLDGSSDRVLGDYKDCELAISQLLPGFSVDVRAVFAAAEE
jgi:Uma2 family endonuclease